VKYKFRKIEVVVSNDIMLVYIQYVLPLGRVVIVYLFDIGGIDKQ
jgi:hypothetical protein